MNSMFKIHKNYDKLEKFKWERRVDGITGNEALASSEKSHRQLIIRQKSFEEKLSLIKLFFALYHCEISIFRPPQVRLNKLRSAEVALKFPSPPQSSI